MTRGTPSFQHKRIERCKHEISWDAEVPPHRLSPPEGEMPGRAEGGNPD
jgi:hypothetical protein